MRARVSVEYDDAQGAYSVVVSHEGLTSSARRPTLEASLAFIADELRWFYDLTQRPSTRLANRPT